MRRDEFERVVDEVLESLPEWALERIHNLRVVVEEWPTAEQDPEDEGLLGLYDGIALPERDLDYVDVMPDTVWIFRQPHLALALEGEALREEIRRTVLHELAHYFGLDDDYLDEIGWG
ncbi:metallopeptidase family protein [Thioalkalivibrio sp. XN279]|uniref:metallopeptidase family protein n=1 Tax=Thioalkalivibrio sp. XN279 TaxID=2714953 RepID=UPI00140A6237|nr:metallopeptidase family protein [Thioalkalivibrio sp. XN279]NHA15987.1 metallopeptidase family protein [Thioalkalivibrio sp. XN279]